MRPSFLLFALHFAATALAAQSNLGSVEGKVVNSITGVPVKKAAVNIRSATGQNVYFAATDPFGKFHIDNVQPEKYSATADAEGFAMSGIARTVKTFTVGAAQQLTGIEILAAPLNVITGRVLDEDQEPLEGVSVTAMRYNYNYNNGTKTLQSFISAQTDDRGRYRIFDMQPGRYLLAAIAPNWKIRQALTQGDDHMHSTIPEEAYGAVLYPGVPEVSQASTHELKPGEEWTGADFKLRKFPLFHIRGRLNNPELPGGGRVIVMMEKCDAGTAMPGMFSQAVLDRPDGVFDIAAAPGEYCLIVREPVHSIVALRQPVTIKDSDVTAVTLTPPSPFSVKGSITIDGAPPSYITNFSVGLQTEDNAQRTSQISGDLSFQMDYVFPGRHTVVLPMWPLLYAKSIVYGGEDVSSGIIPNMQPRVGLTIGMGTDPGEIDCKVQLGSLESGSPVQVVVIPGDAYTARTDMTHYTSSFAEGTFVMQGLAPGDYRIFALSAPDFEDTRNRDLLKLLEGQATIVTVHPSGHEQASVVPIAASDIERARGKLK